MLAKLLTRDNAIWTLFKIGGLLGGAAAGILKLWLPSPWVTVVAAIATLMLAVGAALGGSPLPHSDSPNQQFEWLRLLFDQGVKPSTAPDTGPKPSTPGSFGKKAL
jgi:hypothetical protein